MHSNVLSSWEIIAQMDVFWTGDLNIDCSALILAILFCIIRTKP